jgi:DNA invertase Pin-like site-specific DNA recombinase
LLEYIARVDPVFVSYLRVSTDKQGRSGLGLEAQRAAVAAHVASRRLLAEYLEVESGRRNDRPQLLAALAHAQSTGATVVIAKLDRLARNVAFIANLMEAGVDFVACDLPAADRLTIQVLAAVAEHERQMISQRTKAAMAVAKARGQVWQPLRRAGVARPRQRRGHCRDQGRCRCSSCPRAADHRRDPGDRGDLVRRDRPRARDPRHP